MPPSEHSRVRASSRPGMTRAATPSSLPYVPQAESLILPDGPVGEEAAELLNEFVHPHHHAAEDTVVGSNDSDEDNAQFDKKAKLPWWKKPSPMWILAIMPFTAIAGSATIAPKIEIYTMLACSVHKPDIFKQNFPGIELGLQSFASPGVSLATTSPNTPHSVPVFFPKFASFGEEPAPPKKNQCASDPVVQAAVAKLTAVITAVMGVLSCVTTGWWGAFSDRHGRTRVMGISVCGLLITDLNFIFVALFSKHIPGGYWFLVVAPFIEGSLGGMTTGVAALHAYLADTTDESVRSRIFSLSLGLMFTGMALGPTLGSLLIRFTGHTLSVFYVATMAHVIYTILVWTVIPESLPHKKMVQNKAKYAVELQETVNDRELNPAVGVLVRLRRLFAFLSPLTVFLPREGNSLDGNPLKKPKKDWNLTLMALAYAFVISIMGSYSYKFQYASATFGWTSETLGYWLSIVGAARALFLTAILPIAIKLFKPRPVILEIPVTPSETTSLLQANASNTASTSTTTLVQAQKTIRKEIHSPSFDLNLARASIFVEVVAYTAMALSMTPIAFTAFGIMGSLGAGFGPALQTVTLALYMRGGGTETGRLFGALSVVQALSSQILGPALYGLVYVKTVSTYPRTIFFVSVVTVTMSFCLLTFVRLPEKTEYRRQSVADFEESPSAHVEEETLVDIDANAYISTNDNDTTRKRAIAVSAYGATPKPPSVHSGL